MWSLFGKTPAEQGEWNGNHRVHVNHAGAPDQFRQLLRSCLYRMHDPSRHLAVLCIGTDRSTGDCLGPLIGDKLASSLVEGERLRILGTLEHPVHAVNLSETIESLRAWSPDPFIIAVDACLGRSESVGFITLKEGPLQPGTGVNKSLPAVGDLHIIGIVNVGGFMEYLVLQNTRLSLVMRMAEIVSYGLRLEIARVLERDAAAPALATSETAVSNP